MIYVFLNIDGVLNTQDEGKRIFKDVSMVCVRRMAEVLNKFKNIHLVLVCEWDEWLYENGGSNSRLLFLKRYLKKYGLDINDKMPKTKRTSRGARIKKYIENYGVENYIIIDNEPGQYASDCKELFLVNPKTGFTKENQEPLRQKCKELEEKTTQEEHFSFDLENEDTKMFFLNFEMEHLNKMCDIPCYISCIMKPTEDYQNTGIAIIKQLRGTKINQMEGVESSGGTYESGELDGMRIKVKQGKFLDFLKG